MHKRLAFAAIGMTRGVLLLCLRSLQQTCNGTRSSRVHSALSVCRYKEFKAALEGLDPKRQSHSPLPIIYQWQAPIAGAGTKCALPPLLRHFRHPGSRMWIEHVENISVLSTFLSSPLPITGSSDLCWHQVHSASSMIPLLLCTCSSVCKPWVYLIGCLQACCAHEQCMLASKCDM